MLVICLASFLLFGCKSKNPMDYLPLTTGGYVGVNISVAREHDGLKKLHETLKSLGQGKTADLESDKVQKVYVGFDMPATMRTAPSFYCVAVGTPGFADEVVQLYKKHGATEGKAAGRATYTSGSMTISPVGKTGILAVADTSLLEKMVAVSKKKQPNARTSPEFNHINSALNEHVVAFAMKAQPVTDKLGPMLISLQKSNPKAFEAIKQVSMLALTFDWDTHPVLDVFLQVPDKTQSDVLVGAINSSLALAKLMPQVSANADIAAVVSTIQAKSAEDGVHLTIEIPAETANKLFDQLEAMKNGRPSFGAPGRFMPGQHPGVPQFGAPATP